MAADERYGHRNSEREREGERERERKRREWRYSRVKGIRDRFGCLPRGSIGERRRRRRREREGEEIQCVASSKAPVQCQRVRHTTGTVRTEGEAEQGKRGQGALAQPGAVAEKGGGERDGNEEEQKRGELCFASGQFCEGLSPSHTHTHAHTERYTEHTDTDAHRHTQGTQAHSIHTHTETHFLSSPFFSRNVPSIDAGVQSAVLLRHCPLDGRPSLFPSACG